MPRPEVALLTNYVPPYRAALFRALQNKLDGFLVLVSTPMAANRPWRVEHDGLNVEVQRTLTLRRMWRHPHGFSEQIYVHIPYDTLSRLARLKPQVVLSAELGARTLQAMLYTTLDRKSRLIVWATVSEYSECGRGKLRELMRRKILPRADAVLVNGASGARYVKGFGVAADRIFFVPYTTNTEQFSSLPLERTGEGGRRLLYVGQLVERKGLIPFLSTFSRWSEANPQDRRELWLVGDGPQRTTLQKMTFPPNLTLRFFGNVGYGELPRFYAQAGILAFPTLADEWGLVVNEAMAAGLPVLGSVYSQAVEELVEDGSAGWTFRPDDAEEMYKALDRALTTPVEKLAEMRLLARRRVEKLTPELVADQILQAIKFVHPRTRGLP